MFRAALIAIIAATVLQTGIALGSVAATPADSVWLGNSRMHPGDTAVYISYLRQAQSGNLALGNLYATEPHARRFDPFWSTAGWLMPPGMDPRIWLFALRLTTVAILIAAIGWAAQATLGRERDVRGFVFLLSGLGGGWAYAALRGATGADPVASIGPPDIETMFSAFPALFEAPHYALSLALQILGALGTWKWIRDGKRMDGLLGLGASAVLLSFHPYFAPWYAVFIATAVFARGKRPQFRDASLILPAVPLAAIYLPLFFDPIFQTHHAQDNRLFFAPPLAWIFALVPFVAAIIWRVRKRILVTIEEHWVLAWIAASTVCLLIPVPWTRQFTQGLGLMLTIAAFPALDALWAWTRDQAKTIPGALMAAMLGLALFLNPLSALVAQAATIASPVLHPFFFVPNSTIEGWRALEHMTKPDAAVITDDAWANLWTPGMALRRVWTGHDHETPDFARKQAEWRQATASGTARFVAWAEERKISAVFLTGPLACPDAPPSGWTPVWNDGRVCLLKKD